VIANRLAATGLVGISATAFVLSFPPHHFALLPWVALVPLFIALRRASSASAAAAVAAIWGLLAAYGITAWLPDAIANYWQQPFLLGLGLFVATSALMGSLQYGLFAAACRSLGRGRWPSPAFVAAAWVAAELGRCRLFGGNPWGLMGYTLAPSTADTSSSWSQLPLQVADLGGVYAVSFVIVACNAAVVDLAVLLMRRQGEAVDARARVVRNLGIAAALVVAAALYGHGRLQTLEAATPPTHSAAIVQGNASLGTTWRPEFYGHNFDLYLKGTAEALAHSPALIVWPENAMSFFAEDEPLYRKSLARLLDGADVEVLAGGPSKSPSENPQYFNSAFVFSNTGDITARYDKERLLPFAEHFPFGAVAYLRRSFGRMREFTPGTRLAPLPTSIGRAGILICNEIMFDEIVVDRVRDGADFLVNLSNDTWIGDELYSLNHLAIGVVRAIETRRFLVRASTSGPSAFVSPTGRVLAVSPLDQRSVLQDGVTTSSEITPFVRFGDLFALLCTAAVLLQLAFRGNRAFLRGQSGSNRGNFSEEA